MDLTNVFPDELWLGNFSQSVIDACEQMRKDLNKISPPVEDEKESFEFIFGPDPVEKEEEVVVKKKQLPYYHNRRRF